MAVEILNNCFSLYPRQNNVPLNLWIVEKRDDSFDLSTTSKNNHKRQLNATAN